jgi:UDP-glucuronate 4-epimerase
MFMKCLVTGGAGFIGNALARRLVADGHEVVVLDNMNAYYDISLKQARLAQLPEGVRIERIDICNRSALLTLCREENFDAICHLAAQAGVRYSLEAPEQYVMSNYVGTFNVFDVAKECGIQKIVFASTSSVYGEEPEVPFLETMHADKPVSLYAATKRGGEILAHTYHHLYGMDIISLRFFTVYGPWGRPDMSPYLFTSKILADESITVFNNGDMRRDFTYVDDIVDGFVRALKQGQGYKVYNLGNGTPVELMDFIRTLEKVTGREAKIEFAPMQPGDVTQTYADIRAAQVDLGFIPITNIETGLEKYVAWYKEFYK